MRAAVVAVCVLATLAVCQATLLKSQIPDYSDYTFEKFEQEYEKTYASNNLREARKALFERNLATIKAHNAKEGISYYMAVNKFADLHVETEMAQFKGYSKQLGRHQLRTIPSTFQSKVAASDLPANVDWRQKNAVSPVKNQGMCGSCWAHAGVETIESALYLATGQMLILSPQQTLECTPNPNKCGGTGGCEGATAELAFQWAQSGITLDSTVPYQGQDAPCATNVTNVAKTGGFVKLPENNGTALMEALATIGPIAISVDASSWSFYGGGIFNGCNVASPDIDHAVQAVGYGVDATGGTYWLVRNSWGPDWGEAGYIRLYRGSSETCGTDSTPGDGSGCAGGPSTVQVCGTCGIWYDNSYPVGVTLL